MRIINSISLIKKTICFFLFSTIFYRASFAQLSGYTYAKEITIDATKVSGSSALIDFPMLVNVTDLDLRSNGNGGHIENINGYDIVFTSSSCGSILDHEIELYDATTGDYVAWVRIPSLNHSTNTIIQMYYGNSSVTSDPSTTDVWTSNYENVYHMNQDPSGSAPQMIESSANSRDATSSGSMTTTDLVAGQIGNGIALDGTDDQFTSSSSSSMPRTVTWTIWLYLNGSANNFDGIFYDGGGVNIMADNTVRSAWNSAWQVATTASVTPSQWAFIAVAINGETPIDDDDDYIYVGNAGSISTYQYDSYNFSIFQDFSSFRIGNQNCCSNTRFLNATIDEARFISTTLSADWITTEYNNQYSPSTFYSFTAEMNAGDLCATLPIELLDFGVMNKYDEYVELNWSTLTETNNDYFTVERSRDGENFRSIGRLDGAGNSRSIRSYSFEDKEPIEGINYYRIRQTDFDGSFDLTRIESVNFNQSLRLQLIPNPATESLLIKGQIHEGSRITIQSLSGITVEEQVVNENISQLEFSLKDLIKGIYILTIANSDQLKRVKFLKSD